MTYSIVKQLSQARKDRGLALEDVAASIGYECVTLRKIEYGDAKPSLGKLVRWAEFLGYDLSIWPKGWSK